jgi:hypothetical protein
MLGDFYAYDIPASCQQPLQEYLHFTSTQNETSSSTDSGTAPQQPGTASLPGTPPNGFHWYLNLWYVVALKGGEVKN